MNTFESLTAEIEARRRDRQVEYGRLIVSILDGREPDAKKADAILAAAGKSVPDFTADVQRCRRRRELMAVVAEEPALAERERAAAEAIRVADERLQAAEQAHSEECAEPAQAIFLIGERRREIAVARTELAQSADPAGLAECQRISAELQVVAEQIRELEHCIAHPAQPIATLDGPTSDYDRGATEHVITDRPRYRREDLDQALAAARERQTAGLEALQAAEAKLLEVA